MASVAGSAIDTQYSAGLASSQDPSGRIWSTGQIGASGDLLATPSMTLVARFLPGGGFDPSFQGSGFSRGPAIPAASVWGTAISASATGATLVEFERDACGTSCASFFAYAARRVDFAGAFDPAFGNAGAAPLDIAVTDVVPDAGGGLLVSGRAATRAAARRVDATGKGDAVFASNAAAALDCGGTAQARASDVKATRLATGKLLVAYTLFDAPFTLDALCVTRLNADGTLDATYGNQGRLRIVDTAFAVTNPAAVLARPDGSAVVVMNFSAALPPNNDFCPASPAKLTLVWATADGRVDVSRPSAAPQLVTVVAAAIQSDGRLLLVGKPPSEPCAPGPSPTLARLTAEGAPDATFGAAANGLVPLVPNGLPLTPAHVIQGIDGAIYVTGTMPQPAGAGFPRLAVVKLGS